MIEGIETVYQQIADSIDESIHEPWSVAWMEGVFFTEHTSYSAEYKPQAGGPPKSFASGRNGRRASKGFVNSLKMQESLSGAVPDLNYIRTENST